MLFADHIVLVKESPEVVNGIHEEWREALHSCKIGINYDIETLVSKPTKIVFVPDT